MLDVFVDGRLLGDDAEAVVPGMQAHLIGCPACLEDHESLRVLAGAYRSGLRGGQRDSGAD
jgi:hypothetical protein